MARTVDEWVGKTDDARVPPRVRQRVFDRHNGICHLTGRKIQPGEKWELEHIHALILGGQHRESNLAPALYAPHKVKTATEMKVKAKTDAVRKKHLGITRPKQTIKSAPFPKSEKASQRDPNKGLPPLPRNNLYEAKTAWAFADGDLVRKKSGSWWEGRVVGTYSTEQTPRGYAVQLDKAFGPVQIYPESALESALQSEER